MPQLLSLVLPQDQQMNLSFILHFYKYNFRHSTSAYIFRSQRENCLLFKYTGYLHCHSTLHGFDA